MFHLERKVEKSLWSSQIVPLNYFETKLSLRVQTLRLLPQLWRLKLKGSHLLVFSQLDGQRLRNLEIWNEDLGRNLKVWRSELLCFWLLLGESPTVLRVPLEMKLRVFSGSLLHHWGWGSCGFKAENWNIRKPWLRDSLYGRSSPQLWTLQVHLL